MLYAGEAPFNNGKVDWWSSGVADHRPDSDHAEQAALPMERFLTYEQVLKGATRAATKTTHSAHMPETQASHKESKNRVLISVLAVISGQSKLRVITLGLLGKRLLVCLPSSCFEFTRPLQYLM